MPTAVTSLFGFWPIILFLFSIAGVAAWVLGIGGDLLTGVALGARHLSTIGVNFGTRTMLLGTLFLLGLFAVYIFSKMPGAPSVSQYFNTLNPGNSQGTVQTTTTPQPSGAVWRIEVV